MKRCVADHLSGFRQSRQADPASCEVVYALLERLSRPISAARAINAAQRLDDSHETAVKPTRDAGGNLKDFHSIRINDQWRLIFKWIGGEPYEVRIVDYH
jgi:plasmid maintenance system killer protein